MRKITIIDGHPDADRAHLVHALADRYAVVTMGMPALFYRFYFGEHGVKALERSILRFAGVRPICTTLIGGRFAHCDGRRARAGVPRKATVSGTALEG